MPALNTAADYIRMSRTLLQDTVETAYRYPDSDFLDALNLAIMEVRRIRPDVLQDTYAAGEVQFVAAKTDVVSIDQMYRVPLVYYITGHVQLQDNEDTQDQRATVFLNKFLSQLMTVQA